MIDIGILKEALFDAGALPGDPTFAALDALVAERDFQQGSAIGWNARAEAAEAELRQANFYRDKLAWRLSMVETAVLELECAVSYTGDDHEHVLYHVRSALDLCKRATKTRDERRLPTGDGCAPDA